MTMEARELGPTIRGVNWRTSERLYGVRVERDVAVPMRDGVRLLCDVFRPDAEGKFPALLGCHPYHRLAQTAPIRPTALSTAQWRHPGQERTNASLEAGDPNLFVRRGYAHVVCSVRGTGGSEGKWSFVGKQEVEDVLEVIRWIARQPWCNGQVGMFGVSYFAWIQLFAAAQGTEELRCLFCPWAATDFYRDFVYRGGLLAWQWLVGWSQTSLTYSRCQPELVSKRIYDEETLQQRLAELLQDEDLMAVPELQRALEDPESGMHPFLVDILLHPLYDEYWRERTVELERIRIPVYLGGDWGIYGLHLPGAFRAWKRIQAPKKLIIGPPVYLDRPLYQLQFEALRWFDHWLKGTPTGILEEPPVRLFVMGTGEWKETTDWPVPGTRWVPLFLHEGGMLLDREPAEDGGSSAYEDSPWYRGSVEFRTPPMVESTEVLGPIVLKLYASSSDPDVFWIASLYHEDRGGECKLLTRGWLRGSHREVDWERSTIWEIQHRHDRLAPLTPGEIYEFWINIRPTGVLLRPGERLVLKLAGVEDPPTNPLELIGTGSLRRQRPARIVIQHNAHFPSYLLLPVTKGNLLGLYVSGGEFPRGA
jgi:putative CocE/NonD family hydrolase